MSDGLTMEERLEAEAMLSMAATLRTFWMACRTVGFGRFASAVLTAAFAHKTIHSSSPQAEALVRVQERMARMVEEQMRAILGDDDEADD